MDRPLAVRVRSTWAGYHVSVWPSLEASALHQQPFPRLLGVAPRSLCPAGLELDRLAPCLHAHFFVSPLNAMLPLVLVFARHSSFLCSHFSHGSCRGMYFVHGGGFEWGSPLEDGYDSLCSRIAEGSGAWLQRSRQTQMKCQRDSQSLCTHEHP